MARRMAAMQAMLNSMTPEQRAQLQQLSDQLLEDMDLRWQVEQLGQNLQQAFPDAGGTAATSFAGMDPLDMSRARPSCSTSSATSTSSSTSCAVPPTPGALAEVDLDRARDLLGDDAARSLERMARAHPDARGGRPDRAARGSPRAHPQGHPRARPERARRPVPQAGPRPARPPRARAAPASATSAPTRPSPTSSATRSTSTSSAPSATRSVAGAQGTPVQLDARRLRGRADRAPACAPRPCSCSTCRCPCRCATTSCRPRRSPWRCTRSSPSQFPRDYLGIVGLQRGRPRAQAAEQLPEVSWDFVYGTNMQHGFQLARQLLARQRGTKQIIMITDGEPTAHINPTASRLSTTRRSRRPSTRRSSRCPLHPGRHPHQHLHARPDRTCSTSSSS